MSDEYGPDSLKMFDAYLEDCREKHEAGDGYAALRAVCLCGKVRLVMPEWVVDAFHKATNMLRRLEVKTLDEAFGVTFPKGKHINALRKFERFGFAVHHRVQEEPRNGRPIDDGLFEKVGNELGLGKTQTSDYYAIRKIVYSRKK